MSVTEHGFTSENPFKLTLTHDLKTVSDVKFLLLQVPIYKLCFQLKNQS